MAFCSPATARLSFARRLKTNQTPSAMMAVSAGATVSGGEVASSMKNQHGVVIHMHSNAKGLRVNTSLEGVTMKLADSQ